jgi:hypothetical protein
MILWKTHTTTRGLRCGRCGADIAREARYADVLFDGDERTRGRRLTRCEQCATDMETDTRRALIPKAPSRDVELSTFEESSENWWDA